MIINNNNLKGGNVHTVGGGKPEIGANLEFFPGFYAQVPRQTALNVPPFRRTLGSNVRTLEPAKIGMTSGCGGPWFDEIGILLYCTVSFIFGLTKANHLGIVRCRVHLVAA